MTQFTSAFQFGKGIEEISSAVKTVQDTLSSVRERLADMDLRQKAMELRQADMDPRQKAMELRLAAMDERLAAMASQLERQERLMDLQELWRQEEEARESLKNPAGVQLLEAAGSQESRTREECRLPEALKALAEDSRRREYDLERRMTRRTEGVRSELTTEMVGIQSQWADHLGHVTRSVTHEIDGVIGNTGQTRIQFIVGMAEDRIIEAVRKRPGAYILDLVFTCLMALAGSWFGGMIFWAMLTSGRLS